jgi:glycosyltransferase involved in cell wall biosynthesis
VADPRRDFDDQAGAFRWVKRRLAQESYHAADRVVALSQDLQAGVADFYRLPADRVVVARNGIDLEWVDATMQESAPEFEPDRFHIVSAGRLQEQKGFKYLIEALSIVVHQRGHANLRLHILGQGPLASRLRAQVDDCGLRAHVQFHGFQANPLGYFHRANLFCLASLFEGTPNVLMEAMACRVPVIATDCISGPRELLQDGALGCLVPPGDANALADAIDQAVTGYDVCLERVEPARQCLEAQLSLAASVRRTEELLLEVAGCKSAEAKD